MGRDGRTERMRHKEGCEEILALGMDEGARREVWEYREGTTVDICEFLVLV